MIYFDNAATTFPKPKCVIESVNECLSSYCGNPGRASHTLSKRAAEAVYDTREKIANFLNIQRPECVVFTYNATYALNLALKTLITEKCHVITSDIEHNSVIRPLEKLKRTLDIDYTLFNSDGDIEKNIIKEIRPHTRCIVSTLASNVTGKAISLNILSKVSKEYGLTLIIDASQWIGHNQVDLTETPCDVFCAPGHKALFGIQGCGFAVFKESWIKESFIEGGSGYESESIHMPSLLPEGYEAGTLSVPAIVSLGAGIDFINSATISDINSKIASISSFLKKGLSKIDNIILYPSFGSTIAFNHRNYYSNSMSELLDNDGFCVRAGLHCAPSAHKKIGTLDHGCVRLSFS
jgi:selenocysteine lyase/cysteine desulfurase